MILITGMAHLGVRVAGFERSVRFCAALGFSVIRDDRKERVVVQKHSRGVEMNLLGSADNDNEGRNVLMDEPAQFPGYMHIVLRVADVYASAQAVQLLNISVTEGPVTFGDGSTSIFFRDPDCNVIELSQPHPEYAPQLHAQAQVRQEEGK